MRKVVLLCVWVLVGGMGAFAEDGDEVMQLPKAPVHELLSASSLLPGGLQFGNYSFWGGGYDEPFRSKWYKGFVDFGVLAEARFKLGSKNEETCERMELSTSHGYLFSPRAYLGLGIGFHFYPVEEDEEIDYGSMEVPIFVHFRSHAHDQRITPFVDLKVGYFVHAIYGLYFNPSVGCRFYMDDFFGLSVSLGYSLNSIRKTVYDLHAKSESISIKVGFDF